jgi:hypothetical protein
MTVPVSAKDPLRRGHLRSAGGWSEGLRRLDLAYAATHRVAAPDEHEVEDQTTGATVPVAEGMDTLEPSVESSQVLHERAPSVGSSLASRIESVTAGMEVRERCRSHPAAERVDVVQAEAARTFTAIGYVLQD